MQSWNLLELEMPDGSRDPIVLHSTDDVRAVAIGLNPGQELGAHQVHEDAFVVVVDGEVDVESAGERVRAGRGMLLRFEANERRRV